MKKILPILFTLVLATVVHAQKKAYRISAQISSDQYSSETIIVKFKSPLSKDLKGRMFGKTAILKSERAIPSTSKLSENHPLGTIYKIGIEKGQDVESAINDLLKDDNVLYAEPYFNHKPLFIPNDPEANPSNGGQNYLSIIHAYDAWTIERGDSTIIIGVLDSGVQPDHPDLKDQIAYNLDDPINGIDDDNDGLIDNYVGWDIADNDNNPTADSDAHGTEVIATSSARANNNEGMAGTGYNSKFMPIKTFKSGSNSFNMGYEAIALAADLGCKVLNLSWGSVNSFSQFGQDVINYAVLEKDVVIVAAAGNTPERLDFYPASFDNVLSVGASNGQDAKANFSTFSYFIDMMAPGDQIYSATNNSTYASGRSGTSYSSPMVAGAAALLRARFPNLTAQQVMERLRVTADDIYGVGSNSSFEGLLGKGRLNMLRALTDETPALRIDSMFYVNGTGNYAYYGDTLDISLRIKNYLSPLANATVSLSSNSPYVTVLDEPLQIPTIGTLEKINNFNTPFKVVLAENTPPDEELIFRIDFNGLVYEDFEYFNITTSSNFTTISGNQLAMTMASDGDIAYDEDRFNNGIGVNFEGGAIASNIGVILAFDKNTVPDNAPTNMANGFRDEDFEITESLKRYSNSSSPTDIRSVFSVADSIRIEQSFLSNETDDFILQQYRIVNKSLNPLTDFTLGIFADWNIGDKDMNEANWLADEKMGYIHNGKTYIGMALITAQNSVYSAINNKNFNGNTADIPSILNDSVKFSHVSQGILKTMAGENNGGNDVSHLVGATIASLTSLSVEKVIFATVAGHSVQELIDNLNLAKAHLNAYGNNPPIITITETCVGDPATINPASGTTFDFYEDAALTTLLFSGEAYQTPPITNRQAYYVVNKDEVYPSDIFQVIAKPKHVNTSFQSTPEVLLLDETGKTTASFRDTSTDGVSWLWDFNNGFTSTMQNPIMNFTRTGSYTISLNVVNDLGCEEAITKTLLVDNRSNKPNIPHQVICKGEEITLDATNSTNLEFYENQELTNLIASGTFLTARFEKDTTLYIVSVDSTYKSNPQRVFIDVDDVSASFIYQPDTTDISSSTLLNLHSTSENNVLNIWYNNNELISTEDTFNFDYTGLAELNLLLVAESLASCTDSVRVQIPFEAGTPPAVQSIDICMDESVILLPGGSYNHFYTDPELNNLIAKGSELTLTNLRSDTSFYVTNNASLQESAPAQFIVNVSDIKSQFNLSANPLNLTESNTLQLTDESVNATTWLWLIDSDTLSTTQNPEMSINDIGTYDIILSVSDALGCIDSSMQRLEVTNITSIEDQSSFLIYPNPVENLLIIKLEAASNVKLLDQTGKILNQKTGVNLDFDVQYLPSGIYFLEIESGNQLTTHKIIKTGR